LTDDDSIRRQIEAIYESESRRVLATLIRLLGDFDRAEEALHDAVRAALEQWPPRRQSPPTPARGWCRPAGSRRSTAFARQKRFDSARGDRRPGGGAVNDPLAWADEESVEDDRLRLIFTCCHPGAAPDAQIALTLREVCGLTTEEIAQRVPHAGADAGAADRVAPRRRFATRTFPIRSAARSCRNGSTRCCAWSISCSTKATPPPRGAASSGHDLAAEAIRLGRLLVELLPEPEAMGLLALDAAARVPSRGAHLARRATLCFSTNRIRSLWDRAQIAEGVPTRSRRALRSRRVGPYALQAAIAALHAEAATARDTDWARWSDSTTC
jgi:RNA polymerase sigma-70 factor (ECF subfamily)